MEWTCSGRLLLSLCWVAVPRFWNRLEKASLTNWPTTKLKQETIPLKHWRQPKGRCVIPRGTSMSIWKHHRIHFNSNENEAMWWSWAFDQPQQMDTIRTWALNLSLEKKSFVFLQKKDAWDCKQNQTKRNENRSNLKMVVLNPIEKDSIQKKCGASNATLQSQNSMNFDQYPTPFNQWTLSIAIVTTIEIGSTKRRKDVKKKKKQHQHPKWKNCLPSLLSRTMHALHLALRKKGHTRSPSAGRLITLQKRNLEFESLQWQWRKQQC